MTPKPTIDADGVPRCSRECEAFVPSPGCRTIGVCSATTLDAQALPGRGGSVCVPALRARLKAAEKLAEAAEALLGHCQNNMQICGLVTQARDAIKAWKGGAA